ncbi:hypothetical protein Hanom_Chr12g01137551 [Helianthus anomalus]
MAVIKRSRKKEEARGYLDNVDDAYKEARQARRWDVEKECYVDPKGNPTVDPDEVDFEALVAAIPTVDVWCRGLREIPRYREKLEEQINKNVDEDREAEEATVPNAEVRIHSESYEKLDKFEHINVVQCKKCMETCEDCTEKDNSLRSRDIEFTEIEKIFKEKCNEMFENEKFLKQ